MRGKKRRGEKKRGDKRRGEREERRRDERKEADKRRERRDKRGERRGSLARGLRIARFAWDSAHPQWPEHVVWRGPSAPMSIG